MLLSIDRVLQLLIEGKEISKIAEMSDLTQDDVIAIIQQARELILKYDKPISKKKVILKKTAQKDHKEETNEIALLLAGAELSAVPVNSQLVIYAASAIEKNGHAGIGLIIHDKENRQVGKISTYIGKSKEPFALFNAMIRAIKIAEYLKTVSLKIRIEPQVTYKQLMSEIKSNDKKIIESINAIWSHKKLFKHFKIENVSKMIIDKASFLAKRAINTPEKPV